MFNPPKLH
jgi:hypothetical protein